MNSFQKILDSFSVKSTLNPKIWENANNAKKATMKPKVQKALMRIAEEFIEYLGEDVFVEDIVLTGSLANFNWSEYSDFDLHIHVNLDDENSKLYKEIYNLKKQIFNEKHNIKIFGYDVELYAQDTEEAHYSSGVYSVMNDEWIERPKEFDIKIDRSLLEKKIKMWSDKIDEALTSEDTEQLEKIKSKIKEYRQSGLEKDGELSYENLVFKYLRRSGHIEKLFKSIDKVVDKELSLERKIEESASQTK
jgi:predicted nucleotidyltransferase